MNLRTYLSIKQAGLVKRSASVGVPKADIVDELQREKVDPRITKKLNLYDEGGVFDPYTYALADAFSADDDAADDYGFDRDTRFDDPDSEIYTSPNMPFGPHNPGLAEYARGKSVDEAVDGINRGLGNFNAWCRDKIMKNPIPRRQDYIDAGYKLDPLKPLNRYFRSNGLPGVYPDQALEPAEDQ